MGIGDWGFGVGVLGFGAMPQAPTPKPQAPFCFFLNKIIKLKNFF